MYDFLSGADTVEILNQIRTEVTQILGACGFNLAKWHSNYSDSGNTEISTHFEFNDSNTTRALGIMWKTEGNTLMFQLENNFQNLPSTKHSLLYMSFRIYNPLGLLAPITTKSFYNLDWDESVPQRLDTTWKI